MLQQPGEIGSLSWIRNFEDEIVGNNRFKLGGISVMSVDPGEELGGDIEELFTTHFGCRKLMSKGRSEKGEATTLELLSLFTGKAYCSFRESSRAKLNLIYHKFCVIG